MLSSITFESSNYTNPTLHFSSSGLTLSVTLFGGDIHLTEESYSSPFGIFYLERLRGDLRLHNEHCSLVVTESDYKAQYNRAVVVSEVGRASEETLTRIRHRLAVATPRDLSFTIGNLRIRRLNDKQCLVDCVIASYKYTTVCGDSIFLPYQSPAVISFMMTNEKLAIHAIVIRASIVADIRKAIVGGYEFNTYTPLYLYLAGSRRPQTLVVVNRHNQQQYELLYSDFLLQLSTSQN